MKSLFYFLVLVFFSVNLSFSQEPTQCLHTENIIQDTIPNYLQPWWNQIRTGKLAVVYVDFPDGRWNDNGVLRQPYTNQQLDSVPNKDAAGEVGVIKNTSGQFEMQASKYSYYDRWNLLFDSLGVYNGTAHPDFLSHGDSAYGSMKQYWEEASNGKFDLIPYQTRTPDPNIDNRLWRGIINDYEMVNGIPVIKNILLPKNKYGTDEAFSYFRSYEDTDSLSNKGVDIIDDTKIAIQSIFDLNQFYENGGILMIVFAGSHQSFKGIGLRGSSNIFVVRGRFNQISNLANTRIDGFGITAHEYGHIEFTWDHTNSARYDIMNAFDVHFKDCPQLPNPVFRLKEGWLNPIAMENTQQIQSLEPIETSYQCGVITIYGKPNAAPDWSSGECYIVENRRRIGFDRKIAESFPDLLGGLLIWHYSPYKNHPDPVCGAGFDKSVKFISAVGNPDLCGSRGDPQDFFAYAPNIPPGSVDYYNIDSARTHSGDDVKTGIELRNIRQINYSDLNSSIKFDLNYLISEPKVYDYIVYQREYVARKVTLSNDVFYHEKDISEFYKILPGTVIDVGSQMRVKNIEARGETNNMITFKGPSFSNSSGNYISNYNKGFHLNLLTGFQDIDSCYLENINIQNMATGIPEITCNQIYPFPISLKNIIVTSNFTDKNDYDLDIFGSYISELDLSNMQISFRILTKFTENVSINSSRVSFYGNNFFAHDKNYLYTNSKIDNYHENINPPAFFYELTTGEGWQGIRMDGGGIEFRHHTNNSLKIKNANIGIDITDPTETVIIKNMTFENNKDYDISLYKTKNENGEIPVISQNIFSQNNQNPKIANIILSECEQVSIDTNNFNNTGYFGIILMNSQNPIINYNTITGGNLNGTSSSGIFSYGTNGFIKCNTITQCMNYGVLLDNSLPVLFNNIIAANGLGLYLSNNSNPIMAPAYLLDQTYVLGGYNYIHHNGSEEIYCNNSKYNYSTPLMYKGFNSIVDDSPNLNDILIYNKEVSGAVPFIDCPYNYWGGGSPSGRLFPDYSFNYADYLTSQFSYACDVISDPAENSSEPNEYLLLGNVLKNQYLNNFENSINYSNQLLSLQNSEINSIISLNNLFTSNIQTGGNFNDLRNYYLNQINLNPEDTIKNNKLLKLSIESKIVMNELESAVLEYDEILNNNLDEEIRFYTSIERSRAIRLLLDSLLSFYQGDNISQDLKHLYENAINVKSNPNFMNQYNNLHNEDSRNIESNKTNKSKNSIKAVNNFNALRNNINERISNLDNLNDRDKRNLIVEKNILDLAISNQLDNIASIKDKLQYLNQKEIVVPLTYKLSQNYPNPFNPTTKINFSIPKDGKVVLKIYDVSGKEVYTLVNEFKQAGNYNAIFNGSNLSSGVYFYRLNAGDFVESRRMILLK